MAHDVFISYSSKDKTVADAVCARLEKDMIRCWVAPRDVPPGQSWVAAIVNAISESKVFVLVFSDGSNKSNQVIREVGEAVDNGVPIIPFRIEDVEPSNEMRYYIKSIHWLDAMTPPLEKHLQKLSNSIQALLSVETGELSLAAITPVVQAPARKSWPLPTWATILLILASALFVGGVGWLAVNQTTSAPTTVPATSLLPSPTGISSPASSPTDTPSKEPTPSPGWSDWRTLFFNIPNEIHWSESEDGIYTALDQHDMNTFAWSEETIEGDLILTLNASSSYENSEALIIVYGNGRGYSFGNLVFAVDAADNVYKIERDLGSTVDHGGENWLILVSADVDLDFKSYTYTIIIEIIDDKANMYVDGEKVLSTFIPPELNRQGMIALVKFWQAHEITYSNIQLKTFNSTE